VRIVIGSVISAQPYSPGMVWNWMQHAVGLARLGHDVVYVEEVPRELCVDASGAPCPLESSVNLRSFRDTMSRFNFLDRACLIHAGGNATFGMSLEALETFSRQADLLLNISGHVTHPCVVNTVRRRVYMDQDPVYTQLWRAEYKKTWNFDAHDVYVTVGLNIGTPHTPIPDCGIEWHRALPPVLLDCWDDRPPPADGCFTTIASWQAGLYDLQFRDEWYGSKSIEFERFAALPTKVDQRFEVALRKVMSGDERVQLLRDRGWIVSDAGRIDSLAAYQEFIAGSRAEIGIAKNSYVKGRSGWFSDRTAHYLANGRPALAQATGFERHLPTGRGLLSFTSLEEAVDGVERINRAYAAHAQAAREIAAEFLDYRKVLPRLLEDCMARPASRTAERR